MCFIEKNTMKLNTDTLYMYKMFQVIFISLTCYRIIKSCLLLVPFKSLYFSLSPQAGPVSV